MKKILILLLMSLIITSCSSKETTPPNYSNRGIWFWAEPNNALGSSQILANILEQERAIDFLKENNFKRIYGEYQDTADYLIADWNQSLKKANIESQLLLAENVWLFARQRHLLFERLDKELIAFNNSVDNKQKFDAIHLNLEPHALSIWKDGSPEKRRELLDLLLETLTKTKEYLAEKSKDDIKIYYDLVVWYDDLGSSIAWKNSSDRDAWFTDFAKVVDGVSLMAYSRDYDAILANTAWEIENLNTKINIAIDADIGEGRFWKARAEFEKVMTDLEANYKDEVSLDIHSFSSFYLP